MYMFALRHPTAWYFGCIVSLIALLLPATTLAQSGTDKTITLRASVDLTHNDNFQQSPASAQESEQISSQMLGIKLAIPVSLQRFELDADITNNTHKNFKGFDYIGQNYKAAWQWSVTPQLYGSLFLSRADTLNAIQDSLDPNLRNKNTTTSGGLAVNYGLAGRWQLLGSVFKSNSSNEQALLGTGDSDSTSAAAGFRYMLGSGSTLGYILRYDNGTSHAADANAVDTSSSFTGVNHDFSLAWKLSADSDLEVHLLHLSNRYASVPEFDFSGLGTSVKLSHRFTDKTSVSASWARALASNQTDTSIYTETDTFSLSPSWAITPKTSLNLKYSVAQRRDKGSPTDVSSNRTDTTHNASLGLSWAPRPFATLSANLAWTRQTSSLPDLDYVVKKSTVKALFTF
ncbi:MAG: hypothetical protein IPN53_01170 [Comamonadaceae bacterium]|nr:hypothetical protein [Comamonadaceae bacterium]